jgi:5-methylcytosine-specific restriction enzyme subunit McrC
MERLYEIFVAEWLGKHLPNNWMLKVQEHVQIGQHAGAGFDMDVVLEDAATGDALCVMDTKYKAAETPSSADISQVVAYAEALQCCEAILIYPAPLREPLDAMVGRIRVRSMTFSLAGNLEKAGQDFMHGLSPNRIEPETR